jgi:DNA-binding Lrp family transcriptional regulator
MLHRFLDTIQAGDVQSLLELSRKLDISPAMVLQIAKELTGRGYLQEIGADCNESQPGCSDCAVNSSCQVPVRHWFLTEKGRSAVAGSSFAR